MSHIVEIQTEVRDPAAITAACQRLKLPQPTHGTVTFYNTEATGWQIRLPEWEYPVVCDTTSGQVKFDNYGGDWGDQVHLDHFLQAYAVENSTHAQCTSEKSFAGTGTNIAACGTILL